MNAFTTPRSSLTALGAQRPSRLATVALVAVALLIAALILPAAPASAHDQLVSTDPDQGSTVQTAPEAITMTFSGSPQKLGNEISVVHDGTDVADGDPTAEFHTITQPLTGDLAPGDYEVKWRVVSEDGHPVTGKFSFTLAGDSAAEETPAEKATAEPTDEPTENSSGESAEAAADSGSSSTSAATTDSSSSATASDAADDVSSSSLLIGIVTIVVIVILAFAVLVIVRRRKNTSQRK